MPPYRLYFLKDNCLERWQDFDAPHDLAAIDAAEGHKGPCHVELWCEHRKIATFPAEGQEPVSASAAGQAA